MAIRITTAYWRKMANGDLRILEKAPKSPHIIETLESNTIWELSQTKTHTLAHSITGRKTSFVSHSGFDRGIVLHNIIEQMLV